MQELAEQLATFDRENEQLDSKMRQLRREEKLVTAEIERKAVADWLATEAKSMQQQTVHQRQQHGVDLPPDVMQRWDDWADQKIASAIRYYNQQENEAHDVLIDDLNREHYHFDDEIKKLRDELTEVRSELTLLRAMVNGEVKALPSNNKAKNVNAV